MRTTFWPKINSISIILPQTLYHAAHNISLSFDSKVITDDRLAAFILPPVDEEGNNSQMLELRLKVPASSQALTLLQSSPANVPFNVLQRHLQTQFDAHMTRIIKASPPPRKKNKSDTSVDSSTPFNNTSQGADGSVVMALLKPKSSLPDVFRAVEGADIYELDDSKVARFPKDRPVYIRFTMPRSRVFQKWSDEVAENLLKKFNGKIVPAAEVKNLKG